jgi:hypothetical protein
MAEEDCAVAVRKDYSMAMNFYTNSEVPHQGVEYHPASTLSSNQRAKASSHLFSKEYLNVLEGSNSLLALNHHPSPSSSQTLFTQIRLGPLPLPQWPLSTQPSRSSTQPQYKTAQISAISAPLIKQHMDITPA